MDQTEDILQVISVDKFDELKEKFKSDWPRGITGYYALDTLAKWLNLGQDYGFKVMVPYGDVKYGMVVVIKDELEFTEVIIECPSDDTSHLEEALKTTKLINWERHIVVLFPHKHVLECLKRIGNNVAGKLDEDIHTLNMYVINKEKPLFDVTLPPGHTFKRLTEDHFNLVELIDSKWPHRYPGSKKYFHLLIKSQSGFGIFKGDQIISWGFIKEIGALGHLYTLEEYRKNGYGVMVTKLICNEILKAGKDVYSFCLSDNIRSCGMHEKIGFMKMFNVYTANRVFPDI